MNDPPLDDTVRARMQGIRCEIDGDMEDVSASARSMVDWKHYVKTYPWVCLGAAAALGFLIVPKRSAATRADVATPTEPAKTGHLVVKPAPTAAHGLVDALVAAVVSIAVREAIAYLGQSAERLLGITRIPRQAIMIQIARPESSSNGTGRSSLGLDSGERVDMARKATITDCPGDRAVRGPTAGFLPGDGAIRRNRIRMVGETTMNRRNGSTSVAA